MEQTNEREWNVIVNGYKENDQDKMIKIKEQVDIIINDYNNQQRQIGEVDFVVEKSRNNPPSGAICLFSIEIPDFRSRYDQTYPINRIPKMILLTINSNGQINGALDENNDSPQARDFFKYLRDKFTSYKP